MNSYEVSKNWFDWTFENNDKVKPVHTALYFYILDKQNRFGWKDVFGLPTDVTMESLGIRSYKTYINTLNDLIEFGFIKMVEKSKNQHTANIIEVVKNSKAHTKAHTKASSKQDQSTNQSIVSVDKPKTLEPNNIKTIVEYLNSISGKSFKYNTEKTKSLINARFNDGFTIVDFKSVINLKVNEWKGSDMEKYIRPETLFGNKFESYLNQGDSPQKEKTIHPHQMYTL